MWTAWSKLYRKQNQHWFHCSARPQTPLQLLAQLSSRQFGSCSCEFSSKRLTSPNRCCHRATRTHGWVQFLATPCDGEGYPFSCRSTKLAQIPVLQANLHLQGRWESVLILCELTGLSNKPPKNTLRGVLYLWERSCEPVIYGRFVPISTFLYPFCHLTMTKTAWAVYNVTYLSDGPNHQPSNCTEWLPLQLSLLSDSCVLVMIVLLCVALFL